MSVAESRLRQALLRAEELQAAIRAWSPSESLVTEIVMSDDRRSWQWVARFESHPPTVQWGLLLSEVVHHLRAGLDNVVYASAAQAAGGKPAHPRDIQFPIHHDQRQYVTAVARGCLGEAHDSVEPSVRAFQPYGVGLGDAYMQPGDGLLGQHPLKLLQDLSNTDKHREWTVLPPSIGTLSMGSEDSPVSMEFEDLSGFADDDLIVESVDMGSNVLEHGGPIMTVRCKAPLKQVRVTASMKLSVAVPTGAGPVDVLRLVHAVAFVVGLITFRIEDLDCEIDAVYERLLPVIGDPPAE